MLSFESSFIHVDLTSCYTCNVSLSDIIQIYERNRIFLNANL